MELCSIGWQLFITLLAKFQVYALMWVRIFCINPRYVGQGVGYLKAQGFLVIKFSYGLMLQHNL
jgi:hypothetical protein